MPYQWSLRIWPSDRTQGYKPADEGPSEYQTIPLEKIEDFGVHCKQYYALDVSYFKSDLDRRLLDSLWNKYWVNTLSSSNLITVRPEAACRQAVVGPVVRWLAGSDVGVSAATFRFVVHTLLLSSLRGNCAEQCGQIHHFWGKDAEIISSSKMCQPKFGWQAHTIWKIWLHNHTFKHKAMQFHNICWNKQFAHPPACPTRRIWPPWCRTMRSSLNIGHPCYGGGSWSSMFQ